MANSTELRQELESIDSQITTAAKLGDVDTVERLLIRKRALETTIAECLSSEEVNRIDSAYCQKGNEAAKRYRIRELSQQILKMEEALAVSDEDKPLLARVIAQQIPQAERLASREATKIALSAMRLELIQLTGRDEDFLMREIARLEAECVQPKSWSIGESIRRQIGELQAELETVREWRAGRNEEFLTGEIARLEAEQLSDDQYRTRLEEQNKSAPSTMWNNTPGLIGDVTRRQMERQHRLEGLRAELQTLRKTRDNERNEEKETAETGA